MRFAERLGTISVPLATLGPVGRVRVAPGTAGSLVALVFFWFVLSELPSVPLLIASSLLVWGAVIVCGNAAEKLGAKDPGYIVLDEFVALPLCFLSWQTLAAIVPAWSVIGAGFILFRFFDAVKPLGIRKLQGIPGGLGIVIDDVVAALLTCGVLHAVIRAYSLL